MQNDWRRSPPNWNDWRNGPQTPQEQITEHRLTKLEQLVIRIRSDLKGLSQKISAQEKRLDEIYGHAWKTVWMIAVGDVKVGFKEFAAHMAWGLPARVRDVEVRGRVVHYQTFIRCTSGPRIGDYVRNNIDCDGTSSEVEIAVENGVISELKYLD